MADTYSIFKWIHWFQKYFCIFQSGHCL